MGTTLSAFIDESDDATNDDVEIILGGHAEVDLLRDGPGNLVCMLLDDSAWIHTPSFTHTGSCWDAPVGVCQRTGSLHWNLGFSLIYRGKGADS